MRRTVDLPYGRRREFLDDLAVTGLHWQTADAAAGSPVLRRTFGPGDQLRRMVA
jgi:hypothetical protein